MEMGPLGRVWIWLKIRYRVGSGDMTVRSVKVSHLLFKMVSYCLLLACPTHKYIIEVHKRSMVTRAVSKKALIIRLY